MIAVPLFAIVIQAMTKEKETQLEGLRQVKRVLLERIQQAKEELDRVDFAIKVLEGTWVTNASAMGAPTGQRMHTTKKGSIRNLSRIVLELLEKQGRVMTASQMAEALFESTLDLTPEQLRRRLSVKTSFMYKDSNHRELLDSGVKNERREIYWALPQWFDANGKIDRKRLPNEQQ